MRPHLFAGLLASLATRTYSLDTSTPECATICSRELMHYHGIPTVEGLCHDMVVQRELFSCLASSCTEQYGQALTYTISTCSSHGGTISDLLPVEIQHTSLVTRHFMPLVSRSDSASFGFESRFSLSVDCKAGSDGVLTLSLPESTASVHQSIPDGGSPASPGAGNGNLNAGAGPPGGAPGPNNGPLPGNTASSGDGQVVLQEAQVLEEVSGNHDGQYQPAPAPAPAPTPANSNPQPDGQANGPPAPGPDAADGNSSPDNPHQGNPGQSQPQPAPAPAPAPSSPDGGDGAPNQDGTGGPGEDCDENAPPGSDANSPGNNAAPASPPNTGGSVDCSIDINNPVCANQNQLPPGPPAPQPPAPQPPAPAPDSSTPQGPPPSCGAEAGISDCPASHQPPNGDGDDGGDGNACSDPNSNVGCGSSEPSSLQPPPQPAPPAVPNNCSGDENSPCNDGGDGGSNPGSRSLPANPPSPNSPDVPPPEIGPSPAAPPSQPNTIADPDNEASCNGKPDPCPANSGTGIPEPANPPSPASPPSTPPDGQVPNGPQDNYGTGRESSGKGSDNGDGGKGNGDLGPQAPEITAPPVQPALPAPATPAQLPGPPVQSRPPQPTDSNAVGRAHEGPQVITVIIPTQVESTATKVMTV
ncbi:hypothetical protein NW756_005901 [Fusarium oxysporum]|nr:hypothetical protein NW756_005901 [Fusarium oxysporum]